MVNNYNYSINKIFNEIILKKYHAQRADMRLVYIYIYIKLKPLKFLQFFTSAQYLNLR